MRRLGTISTLSFLGAFSALLAGCPIWNGDPGPTPITPDGGDTDITETDAADSSRPPGDGNGGDTVNRPDTGRPDAGPPDLGTPDTGPMVCTSDMNCAAGEYCDPGNRVCVPGTSCSAASPCTVTNTYCDDRGVCVPGCDTASDCAGLGAGLVCNPTTHRCEAGGGCVNNASCPSGEVCTDGTCRTRDDVCTFDFQCGTDHCVDGRCVAACSVANPCPSGQTCRGGFCETQTDNTCTSCLPSQICNNGVCENACSDDTACGMDRICDHGVCRPDDRRPDPFCTPTTGCAPQSACVDGICRIKCPAMDSMGNPDRDRACQEVDFNFTTCNLTITPPICRYSEEQAPECTPELPCAVVGARCINAHCVAP